MIRRSKNSRSSALPSPGSHVCRSMASWPEAEADPAPRSLAGRVTSPSTSWSSASRMSGASKRGSRSRSSPRTIARRTLLQSLNVRPVLDAEGVETGMFEIPAGGRRYQALALLVKQKRLAKTALIPCVVRDPATSILAEDDFLAENVQRVARHPLDQCVPDPARKRAVGRESTFV